MHRAAYCGHTDVVVMLMKEGADGEIVDSDGKTPFHKVIFWIHLYIIIPSLLTRRLQTYLLYTSNSAGIYSLCLPEEICSSEIQ